MNRFSTLVTLAVLCLQGLHADQRFESRREGHPINDPDKIGQMRSASTATSSSPNGISFHGGAVMTGTVNVYYIWYGNWNGNDAITLLENLAKSIGGSPYFNINSTYTDQSGAPVRNSVVFAGSANDNYSLGKDLSDPQIQQIVASAISSGKLPKDPNGVYFVLTSADVNESSGFCSQYCGWHTYGTIAGTQIKYSFVGDAGRCLSSCSAQSTSPNGNPGADAMASVVAHELQETVTDPNLNAWFDDRGQENADKCAWTFGLTFAAKNGSRANMTLGAYNYLIQQNWVNSGGGACVLQYVTPGLSSISPNNGAVNSAVPVTLTGSNFGSGANLNISGAGVTASNVTVVSPTQITAKLNIAAGAAVGARNVTVTMGMGTSGPAVFTVTASGPTITTVAPADSAPGKTVNVTLTGTGFVSGATLAVSGAGITAQAVKFMSATQMTAQLAIASSAAAGPRNITVTTPAGTSAPVVFTVNSSTGPAITGLTPATGMAGKTVAVTLLGASLVSGATLGISGTGVTFQSVTVVSATQITANLVIASGAAAGARSITVTTTAGTSAPAVFTVSASGPVVTGVNPADAPAGKTVNATLTGTGFGNGSTLAISGAGVIVQGIVVVSATQITAQLVIAGNATPGPRNVAVTTSGGASAPFVFMVDPGAPTLTSVSPPGGDFGATVAVVFTGTNFQTGATLSMSGMGITASKLTVVSPTQIAAQLSIAADAATGVHGFTITTAAGVSGTTNFTVGAARPSNFPILPNFGSQGTVVPVIINGTNFEAKSSVTIATAGVTVSQVTVVSSTRISAVFTVSPTAALGQFPLTISGASRSSVPMAFYVLPPAPVITSLSPPSGTIASTVSVTLLGVNFASDSIILTSDPGLVVSNIRVVSPTQITAQLALGTTPRPLYLMVIGANGPSRPVQFTATR